MTQWHHFDQPVSQGLCEGEALDLLATGNDDEFGRLLVDEAALQGVLEGHGVPLLANQLAVAFNDLANLFNTVDERMVGRLDATPLRSIKCRKNDPE